MGNKGMYCENCGKELKEGNLFCEYCGTPVKETPEKDMTAARDPVQEAAEALRGGDQDAFQEIYHGTYQTVYKIVRAFFPNSEQDREDCIQMAYMRVYEKIGLYDPEKGRFVPWMKMVVENLCRDEYVKIKKKKGAETSIEDMSDESGQQVEFADEDMTFNPEARADRNETQRLINEIVGSLPEKLKQTVLLYYSGEYKQDEVANLLGVSLQTVKYRLRVGRDKIEECVLALEKRGTKLYSMAPITFFAWLLSNDSTLHAEAAEAAPFLFMHPEGGPSVQDQQAPSDHTDIGQQVTDPTGSAAQAVANAGQGAVSTATAGTAAAGKAIAVKVIAGIAAAAVIGGGSYAGVKIYQGNSDGQQESAESSTGAGDPEAAAALMETIDQEELAVQLVSSFINYDDPEENTFSPDNPISVEQLNAIYSKNIYANMTGVEGTNYLANMDNIQEVQPDGLVTADLSIFDKINEVYGISDELIAQMISESSKGNDPFYTDDTVTFYVGTPDIVDIASVDQLEQKDGIIEVDYTVSILPEGTADNSQYTAILQPADNEFGYQIISIQYQDDGADVETEDDTIQGEAFLSLDEIDSYERLAGEYGKFFYGTGEGESIFDNDWGMFDPYHGMGSGTSEDHPAIYYALYDMNGDGVEECFFTSDPGTEQTECQGYYGIWTMANGKPVQLDVDCGYRIHQYITEDGHLRNEYSGGAFSSGVIYYKIGPDGKSQIVDNQGFESDNSDEVTKWLEEDKAKHPRREGLRFDWIEIEK